MKKGKLFIISGPSGVGKSTVLQAVLSSMPDLYFSVSATTRPARPGEVDGREYYFVTEEHFAQTDRAGGFLESARYVDYAYGTPLAPILEKMGAGIHVLLDIEVQGAIQVKEKMPEAVMIFLSPPSMETLEERLRSRGTDTDEKIEKRLLTAAQELSQLSRYDYLVVNDTIEQAVSEIREIILGI